MAKSETNHNLWFYYRYEFTMIVLIYVDDLSIIDIHVIYINVLKHKFKTRFEISKLEALFFY